MHPTLCEVVSSLAYNGRLAAHPSTASRTLGLAPAREGQRRLLDVEAGVMTVAVDHAGNTEASEEEVVLVRAIAEELLNHDLTALVSAGGVSDSNGGGGGGDSDSDGGDGVSRRGLTWDDLLFVTPYNQQVRRLSDALGPQAKVGTVDRFQGQEAPVVIVSLCRSSFDDQDPPLSGGEGDAAAPGVEAAAAASAAAAQPLAFVLDVRRLNVALSRAQCLAVVVMSPRLAQHSAGSLSQMERLSFASRLLEENAREEVASRWV